ncbi:fatty acid--CoA ligase [Geomonas sp. RF6]|uniref:fatty acid--CoA ligase n=1 Tax=Geomonas sp. RF6 TaxID=2897342 RepID=UPI001E2C93B3|nr:fatty acid--CoA ligase [Geomonas sp. RF6]UFS70955.1 fatty acid--CoA ligase [Geomonas sp. RF6]
MTDTLVSRTHSAYDYPLIIKNLLFYPVVDNPDQEIVYRDHYRGSYRNLRERIARLANALIALGVNPGDTVAVMDWDSHRYLELFFAVPMIGAVLHTINIRLSPEQILYTIDHAEDDVLLVNTEFIPILEQIRGRIDTVHSYVALCDDGVPAESTVPYCGEYEALLAAASPDFHFPDFDEDTRATTFYTTGTTGLPKGVYFSHRQLVLHTMSVLSVLGSVAHGSFGRNDVYMPMTPMFHVHAWGIPYVATMLGVKQVYPGRYSPDLLLHLKEQEGVTFSHCVPTILHMLLQHPHMERIDVSDWKLIIGGAAMSRTLCMDALRRGIDVFAGYGMSETCPILTISQLTPEMLELPLEEQAEIRCRTGISMPLVDLRVVDENMRELPRDGSSTGEVVVRAPWLTQGYLKDHKFSERLWKGGYLHTGDLAVRDERGYLRITDRSKDVLKVAGEWVSSLELEDIVAHHPAVAEVAVIGQPDAKWGERPLALVVLKSAEAGKVTEKDVTRHVKEYADKGVVSKQVVLVKVRFVDALDKTSAGKVSKVTLREKYLR